MQQSFTLICDSSTSISGCLARTGEITLSVQELPAGIYACKLLADGQPVATQKLVVVQ